MQPYPFAAISAALIVTLVAVVVCVEMARLVIDAGDRARAREAEFLAMLETFGLETGFVNSIAEGRLDGRWVRLWREWGDEVRPCNYMIDIDGETRVLSKMGRLSALEVFRGELQRLHKEFEAGAKSQERPDSC